VSGDFRLAAFTKAHYDSADKDGPSGVGP